MHVDVVTLLAQLVNFALLLVVLWRVLFRPLADTLRHRETRMEEELVRTEQARADAEREASALRSERARLEGERARGLQILEQEIEVQRGRLLDEVRAAAEEERGRQRLQLHSEWEAALPRLLRSGGRLLADTLDRGLRDLAGRSLHAATLARFEERLGDLPEEQRQALRESAAAGPGLTLASAEPLDEATRQPLERLLARELGVGIARFVCDPALLAGLELRSGDHGLGWSLRHLADDVTDTFEIAIGADADHAGGGRESERR